MSFLFSQLLRNASYFVLQVRLDRCKARQTRFIALYQPLSSICVHGSKRYTYIRQIYSTMAIKSGCVIAWMAIMTIEEAGLKGNVKHSLPAWPNAPY